MSIERAPGLHADWLSAWLAAIGVTVLLDGATLRWEGAGRPRAEFGHSADSLASAVAEALPNRMGLRELVIANPDKEFPRKVSRELYLDGACRSRSRPDDFSLSSTVTDLVRDDSAEVRHSPLDPPAPRGETLWNRVVRCIDLIASAPEGPTEMVQQSLQGTGRRVEANGLGFDVSRVHAGDPPVGGTYVDPVVEALAFFGLALFPVRGNGDRELARGWMESQAPARGHRRRRAFHWAAWDPPLDRWGIDALLAVLYAQSAVERRRSSLLGATSRYESVAFRPESKSDVTRGFASRLVYVC